MSEQLRLPCEHGRYDKHHLDWELTPVGFRCPGGHPVEAEKVWICGYPEFNDDACMVDHRPHKASQPRKHTTCGWFLAIPDSVIPDPLIPLSNPEGEK